MECASGHAFDKHSLADCVSAALVHLGFFGSCFEKHVNLNQLVDPQRDGFGPFGLHDPQHWPDASGEAIRSMNRAVRKVLSAY